MTSYLKATSTPADRVPVHIYPVREFLFSKNLDLNLDLDRRLQLPIIVLENNPKINAAIKFINYYSISSAINSFYRWLLFYIHVQL